MKAFRVHVQLALTTFVLVLAALVAPAPTMAATAQCDVPFIAVGSSSSVDGTTVAVTAAHNTKDGGRVGFTNYYWHDVASGGGASTTWTFSDPVTTLTTVIAANADGVGGAEKYTLDGYDSLGNNVFHYEAQDINETKTHTSSGLPIARVELTFIPLSGVYGSVIKLQLPRTGDLCTEPESLNATVEPDDKTVAFGEAAPTYTFITKVAGSPVDLTNAPGWVAPTCTSSYSAGVSPAGTPLTISCSGGAATGYSFDTSDTATLTVTKVPTAIEHTATDYAVKWRAIDIDAELTAHPACTGDVFVRITPSPVDENAYFDVDPGNFAMSDWAIGRYTMQAFYPGDGNCYSSESTPTSFALVMVETELENTSDVQVTTGDKIRLSAVLDASVRCDSSPYLEITPNPVNGKGTAQFQIGEYDTSSWVAGTYKIQAIYEGDTGCGPSESLTTDLVVQARVVNPEPEEKVLKSGTIKLYFDKLSAKLTNVQSAKLSKIRRDSVRIKVTGYVQGTNATANDQTLSRARAKSVAALIASLGFNGKLKIVSGGVATEKGWQARRVLIKFWYWSS